MSKMPNSSLRIMLKSKRGQFLFLIGIGTMLLLTIIAGVKFGSVDVTWKDTFLILIKKILKRDMSAYPNHLITILWEMRFPRMLLALSVGGGLAICGVAMQALTQNVLAESYILGVSSGASAMVALAYWIAGGFII